MGKEFVWKNCILCFHVLFIIKGISQFLKFIFQLFLILKFNIFKHSYLYIFLFESKKLFSISLYKINLFPLSDLDGAKQISGFK